VAALALALAACKADDTVKQTVKDVLSLKTGTVSDLKSRRGLGPFREYPVPPAEMLDLVAEAISTKVVAVFPDPRAGEVVAKERVGKDRYDDWYAPDWVSAVAVYVHPVIGAPDRSKVEIHWTNRGRFHRGSIDWANELPPLLDAAVAKRGTGRTRPL